ncbi:MarR family winged helix-turn-helix transcriptional regulator [Parvibaculum sp.]|uniref:MarR family winged helix-turn-helix transcriptional regulator n=1 Tax=Parvibaculum sp. TaxID=2024848 RepID=UPI00321083B1
MLHKPLPVPRSLDLGIGFLIGDSSRMLRRIFNDRIAPLGLTQAQWRALVHLSRNEGLNQVSLADLLDVQPITVARLIDKLVAAGLVERRPDPKDRRAQRLFLTEQAAPLLEQIWDVAEDIYGTILGGFARSEVETLAGLLERLRGNVAAVPLGASSAPARGE